LGWGAAKSLKLRGSPPGGVLQEIQLGQKRCHALEHSFLTLCLPLQDFVFNKTRNGKEEEEEDLHHSSHIRLIRR
jgi:hypothetical protein